ncbi:MAG: DUF1624 domain-containing protein [Acidobacteriaceae bacterium]|nr:DUF1624 domain-containing protein [Acidobacteriaceae bacterium]
MDINTRSAGAPISTATAPKSIDKQRILSLDALRGLTVALMILVNNAADGASSYRQLRHSVWNGCTLTDVVFPLFLFIMGVSTAISFQSRIVKGANHGEIMRQVLRRTALIILIGLALNALPIPNLATLRYFGVMQRIGLCYVASALALLAFRPKGVMLIAGLSVLGYWLLLTKVPVPGFGLPGTDVPILDPKGNFASYIDRLLIPQSHRYHFSFYDPEGILSTLPAIASTCLGVLTGIWITRRDVPTPRKLAAMLVMALLLTSCGLAWSQSFPLNKRLWTSSYVLFTAGISLALLTFLMWIVDEKRLLRRSLEPFLAFGANALTAYVFSEVLSIALGSIPMRRFGTLQACLYHLIPTALGSAAFRSLIWSILFVIFCWLPVFYLRRRRIVVKL